MRAVAIACLCLAMAACSKSATADLSHDVKDAGAQIFIRGSANADRAGLEHLYGTPAAFYNCDVQAKVYYTDTGKLLTSVLYNSVAGWM